MNSIQKTECQKTECLTCGCSAEKDEYGDRICYCDTCKARGGCFILQLAQKKKPGCLRCGCSQTKDEYGDRVCYCDTCQNYGCIYKSRQTKEIECECCDEMPKFIAAETRVKVQQE